VLLRFFSWISVVLFLNRWRGKEVEERERGGDKIGEGKGPYPQ